MSSSLNQPFLESNCSAKQNGKKDYMVINCDESILKDEPNDSDNHGTSSSNRKQYAQYLRDQGIRPLRTILTLCGLAAKSIRIIGIIHLVFFLTIFFLLNQANKKNCALLIAATFIQSFVVLFLINRNQSKIPFDVIVKYFASGFCFAPLALFVQSVLILFVCGLPIYSIMNEEDSEDNEDEVPLFFLFCNLINFFGITANIQERCRYYAFFMVDLPYFFAPTSSISSHLRLSDSLEITVNEPIPLGSSIRRRIVGNIRELSSDDYDKMNHPNNMNKPSESNTILSAGTKITVAMMSVAVGFACHINLGLVLVLSNGNLDLGLGILLLRTMLPIDLLCAAIQSIGIRRCYLEDDKSFTMNQTLLPATRLHKSFYYVVTIVLFFTNQPLIERAFEGNPSEILQFSMVQKVSVLVPCSAIVRIIAGFRYFLVQSSAQKERLRYFIPRA